jgi:hypothetical protein
MDMYELERRLAPSWHDTMHLSVVLERLRAGRGVTPLTLEIAFQRRRLPDGAIPAFCDSVMQIDIVGKDLLIPILNEVLYLSKGSKDSILQKKILLKLYEVRRHVYRQYVELEYLNYDVARYLYAQGKVKDLEMADLFMRDVFDMSYFDIGVNDEKDFNDISGPSIQLYKLQNSVYPEFVKQMINRNDKIGLSILLNHPHYAILREMPDIRLRVNQYLKAAGMKPLKEEK